jgi:hypothetical protein
MSSERETNVNHNAQNLVPGQLPPELDFFKYAKAVPGFSISEPVTSVSPVKSADEAVSGQGKKRKRSDEERSG